MVRMPLVLRRIRTDTPRTSETSEVVCRFGRNRRRVLFLAWLTLLPLITPLPVTWQRRAMAHILTHGQKQLPRHRCRDEGVRIRGRRIGVKPRVWGLLPPETISEFPTPSLRA